MKHLLESRELTTNEALKDRVLCCLPQDIRGKLKDGTNIRGWQITFKSDCKYPVLTIQYKE